MLLPIVAGRRPRGPAWVWTDGAGLCSAATGSGAATFAGRARRQRWKNFTHYS
ncbi:hypothetical protein [Enhygromyxa salina]|uniref:hypothetical protein n=1 Tax=Enhygromyxa salina TaxID=215803 RepID=UPI001292E671|nr:hypothetical protein [Enhygromyxa salina]